MKILIAEDDPVTRRLLQASSKRMKFEAMVVEDGVAAWAALTKNDAPALALLDWMMPGMDGAEVCRRLRQRTASQYTYVLLLTSKAGRSEMLEGLEAGADDYLVKPFDLLELKARLRSGERIVNLQDELIRARETLREQATHDALTGIWNRRAILEILERESFRASRRGDSISLIMADIDHFKQINDKFGHRAGDVVLRETARRMRLVLRSYDSVGRYGGEEFSIVVPGCEKPAALNIASRVRLAVGEGPVETSEADISLTLSLGVVTARGAAADPDSLVRSADEALYHAKEGGRNRVEYAHQESSPPAGI